MNAGFFEPPAAPEPQRWEPPAWFQPPTDEVAALVPDRRILARNDPSGVVILLSHIDVFSTGCVLRVRVSVHNRHDLPADEWFDLHDIVMGGRGHRRGRPPSGGLADELLRFGVQFRDGSKATTTGAPMPHQREEAPSGPVLLQHGGGGVGGDQLVTSSWALWLWPLPPPEPFDLVLEWPALGVALQRVAISGGQVRRAADTVQPLWNEAG